MNMSDTPKTTSLDFDLPENVTFYRSSATENFTRVTPLDGTSLTLPPKSITTMVAFTSNIAPTIEAAATDTIVLANQGAVSIGLRNITNGGDNVSTIDRVSFSFSDPALIGSSAIEQFPDKDSAAVTFTPDPAKYGETVLTARVFENTTAENGAFNAFTSRDVHVKIIPYINQAPEGG